MNPLRWLLLPLLLPPLLPGATAEEKRAEEKDRPVARFQDSVQVTATLLPLRVKDQSAAMTLVGPADLAASQASNALAALAGQAGLFVRRNGDFGRADVDIRGIGGNGQKIGVLVDGRPEKMSMFGCAVSQTFPLDNVERIEVVKGPASVLYGSDAMGGVVQIFTKRAERPFEGTFSASYGSFRTAQVNLTVGGKARRLHFLATGDRRSSDGHLAGSDYAGSSFTARVEYEVAEGVELALAGKYFDGRKDEPGSIDRPLTGFFNDYRRGAADLTLNAHRGGNDWQLKLFRNFGTHVFSDGWDSQDRTDGAQLHWHRRWTEGIRTSAGVEWRGLHGLRRSAPAGEWDKSETALFALTEIETAPWLSLSAGGRFQHDEVFGTAAVPQAGLVVHASPRTDLRLHFAGGFRAPQFNELFLFLSSSPGLKPERLWNTEVGVTHRLTSRLQVSATLFRLTGRDFIELAPAAGKKPPFRFQNVARIDFFGVEAGCEALIGAATTVRLSYTHLDPGEETTGRPGHKLDGNLHWSLPKVTVDLSGQWVADYFGRDGRQRRLPNYLVVDARLALSLSSRLEAFLELRNLFDEDYLIFLDLPGTESGPYPMPGRHLNAGIRCRF